tara:strand:- start:922 stop:1023 length:102 start_codon:yes stop_codon:yes gene_type:complete
MTLSAKFQLRNKHIIVDASGTAAWGLSDNAEEE